MDFAVAVVIVSQRRPLDLERCLASLAYQSVINFEVIVVSDRPPLINRFLHAPVKYIELSDRNISKARNIGIEATAAPIIAFCDDDAVPDPFWLERLIQPFYEHPKLGGSTGYVRSRNGISYQWRAVAFNRSGQDIEFDPGTGLKTKILDPHPNYFYKCIGTNCAFRRDALHLIGGFNHAYHYYLDDADVSKRLQEKDYSTALVPSAQVVHYYRASRGRGDNRVPQSLYDLGASTHHFLREHNPRYVDYHLHQFVLDQTARLNQFFHYGMVDKHHINALLRDLGIGIKSGGTRRKITPLPKIAPTSLVPIERRDARAVLTQRSDAQPNGKDFLIRLRSTPTSHAAKLRFSRRGHWLLTMGRFGRLRREGRFWRYRTPHTMRQEAAKWFEPNFNKVDIE